MIKPKYKTYSLYVVLSACLYFVFFQHLDSFQIQNWDESIYAVNACEMILNHNFIGLFYKGLPDLFNTKPPCQVWLQVLFIKLIGYNELAVRLPSAIASTCLALLLFFFIKKRASLIFSLCVFFVFITSFAVATFHTGRTGDADSLLAFFILCFFVSFYKWIFESKEVSLFYFFVFLSLAFLTKSIAALLFMPGIVILILYYRKTSALLKSKWFYLGLLLFIITAGGYVLMRDFYNPGYLKVLINTDLGRYSNVLDSHNEPEDFYFIALFEKRFLWLVLLLPGAALMWYSEKTRPVFVFLTCLFITYFLIISCSVSKVYWYDLPLYPVMSIFSGYAIYVLINKFNAENKSIITIVMLLVVFIIPIYFAFRNSAKNDINNADKRIEILAEYASKNKNNPSLNNTIFFTLYHDSPLYFYKYALNAKGMDFKVVNCIDSLKPNSIVIVAEDSLKKIVLTKYKATILDKYREVIKVQI